MRLSPAPPKATHESGLGDDAAFRQSGEIFVRIVGLWIRDSSTTPQSTTEKQHGLSYRKYNASRSLSTHRHLVNG